MVAPIGHQTKMEKEPASEAKSVFLENNLPRSPEGECGEDIIKRILKRYMQQNSGSKALKPNPPVPVSTSSEELNLFSGDSSLDDDVFKD